MKPIIKISTLERLRKWGRVHGLSKHAFVEMLGKYKVSIFQYDIDEIEEDTANT